MGQRKKTCPRCGLKLWLREFYRSKKTGHLSRYCADCEREMAREAYNKTRKVPDRIYRDESTGRLMEHNGKSTRIYWSPYMLERLKRNFPRTKNEDIALDLGVSQRTVIRKARDLNLAKDPEWMQEHIQHNCKVMHILNRCHPNRGAFKPGEHRNPTGEFKKKNKTEQLP